MISHFNIEQALNAICALDPTVRATLRPYLQMFDIYNGNRQPTLEEIRDFEFRLLRACKAFAKEFED